MIIDLLELEKVLIATWAKFIDPREFMGLINTFAKKQSTETSIRRLTVSRFELTPDGFLIWAEWLTGETTGTTELIMHNDGTISHIRTLSTPSKP